MNLNLIHVLEKTHLISKFILYLMIFIGIRSIVTFNIDIFYEANANVGGKSMSL